MAKTKAKAVAPEAGLAEPKVSPLNPDLQGKFKVVGTHCAKVLNSPIGDIDFRTLTEEQAEQLADCSFEFLQRK